MYRDGKWFSQMPYLDVQTYVLPKTTIMKIEPSFPTISSCE